MIDITINEEKEEGILKIEGKDNIIKFEIKFEICKLVEELIYLNVDYIISIMYALICTIGEDNILKVIQEIKDKMKIKN